MRVFLAGASGVIGRPLIEQAAGAGRDRAGAVQEKAALLRKVVETAVADAPSSLPSAACAVLAAASPRWSSTSSRAYPQHR